VSRDSSDDKRPFAHAEGISNDVVLADVPYRVYNQLGLSEVPRTVLVSPRGVIAGSGLGVLDAKGLADFSRLLTAAPEH